jgi:general secretion pathway protein M
MNLKQRIGQLDAREQRLLTVLIGLFGTFVVLLVPVGIYSWVSSKRGHNEQLRGAIHAVQLGRDRVKKRDLERAAVLERYAKPAPPLAGFLEALGKQNGLEIPESQTQGSVPHGTDYEEKPTKIVLRKVAMYPLAKFMEGIAQSGHPIVISKLNIRKRGVEADSYDVEMVVSAFERKAKEKPAAKAAPGASADKGGEGKDQPAENQP